MMTITEFLTARLDEEEYQAHLTIENRTSPPARALLGPIDAFGHMEVEPEHVLADIASKRAIVAMHGQAVIIDTVVDHLASLYAYHRDYDPSWRVG